MYKKEEFSAPEILLFFEENYRDIHGRKKKRTKIQCVNIHHILENIHYIQELKNRDYFY